MVRTAALLILLLEGCSLDVPVSDALSDCRPERAGDPDCNGHRRQDECTARGLPDAYGVDTGCKHPVRPAAVNRCPRRPLALEGCTQSGNLTCCGE